MTRRRPIALAFAMLALAAGPAPASAFQPGKDIYDRYCAECHGVDGVPNLTGTPDFRLGESLLKPDPVLIDAIRFGVRSMPGFDRMIDNEGLLDVLFYIRALQR